MKNQLINKIYSAADYCRTREIKESQSSPTNVRETDIRNPFWRDYARILHSPSFRRLKGKTQLFPSKESDFFRCRLTHSLEVAEIGKSISNLLNYRLKKIKKFQIDTDLVQFTCLTHDLGHPPFGHQGEEALNICMANYGGFEGNAQTLRIICKLEKKEFDESNLDNLLGFTVSGDDLRIGLNLTFRSIASIIKYDKLIPNKQDYPKKIKKGYYKEEEELVNKIKEKLGSPQNNSFKTIECQIMDISDDIAYSVYDLEDSLKGGFIRPLDIFTTKEGTELISEIAREINSKENSNNLFTECNDQKVFDVLFSVFFSKDDYDQIFQDENGKLYYSDILINQLKYIAKKSYYRTKFCSALVTKYIYKIVTEFTFDENSKYTKLEIDKDLELEIEILKKLTYLFQIKSSKLKIVESNGKNVVTSLFNKLNTKEGYDFLPEDKRKIIAIFEKNEKNEMIPRLICDFIAGMTNDFAIEYYNRLFTPAGITIHKPIS